MGGGGNTGESSREDSGGQVGVCWPGAWPVGEAELGGREERRVIPVTLPLAQAEPLVSPHTESSRVPTLDPLW